MPVFYTVSEKRKLANLFFCSLSVKYKLISIKIVGIFWKKRLTKLCLHIVPISIKIYASTTGTLGNLK